MPARCKGGERKVKVGEAQIFVTIGTITCSHLGDLGHASPQTFGIILLDSLRALLKHSKDHFQVDLDN